MRWPEKTRRPPGAVRAYASQLAPTMDRDRILIVNLSGRGDKDIHTVAALEGIEV
jgi:tryptophan synthase beta chain